MSIGTTGVSTLKRTMGCLWWAGGKALLSMAQGSFTIIAGSLWSSFAKASLAGGIGKLWTVRGMSGPGPGSGTSRKRLDFGLKPVALPNAR